ncbi:MAG TPA: hypothetical protein DCQ58_03610, partial [Saprospirales bacterium]|nr:hypothetical protein [Saprospirales bacterium]
PSKGQKPPSEHVLQKTPNPITIPEIPGFIPKIKSLNELKAEVVTEIKTQKENVREISIELVINILSTYTENHTSPFIS